MHREFFAPKFLVPLTLLLWLLISLCLSLLVRSAEAEHTDPDCPSPDEKLTEGVSNPQRLRVIEPCKEVTGTLRYSERWYDYDQDWNYYVEDLDESSRSLVDQSNIDALRLWYGVGELLGENGNYAPGRVDNLPPPCADRNLNVADNADTEEDERVMAGNLPDTDGDGVPWCDGTQDLSDLGGGPRVAFKGPFVYDRSHGHKEIHPIYVEKWDADGDGNLDQCRHYTGNPCTP